MLKEQRSVTWNELCSPAKPQPEILSPSHTKWKNMYLIGGQSPELQPVEKGWQNLQIAIL